MEALGSSEDSGKSLHGDPDDVALRLLGGERRATGLGVEPQPERLLAPGVEAVPHDPRPHPTSSPVLCDFLEKVVVGVEEEAQPRSEIVHLEAGTERRLHVGDAVGQGEGKLLHRRRAGFSDVVAGDRDRVPSGHVLGAVGEGVGHEPHRGAGRVDVGSPGDVLLQDVVLDRAADLARRDALLLSGELVQEKKDRRRRVDRHRRRDPVEREPAEEDPHVLERIDRHADLAHLALRPLVVGVEAHLGGKVEGARQAGLAGGEQELEALVRRLCCPEAGVLPHRPQPAAVHVPLDASRVGERSRLAELLGRVEAVEVAGAVAALHLDPGLSLTSRIALLSHAGERNPAAGLDWCARPCGPAGGGAAGLQATELRESFRLAHLEAQAFRALTDRRRSRAQQPVARSDDLVASPPIGHEAMGIGVIPVAVDFENHSSIGPGCIGSCDEASIPVYGEL